MRQNRFWFRYYSDPELTQKKPAELSLKMYALMHAWNEQAFYYAYAGIRYYTPDPRIKKALEVARAGHATHNAKRADLVEIEMLNL